MNLDNLPLNLILRHENIKELQSYAEFFFAEKEERLEGLVDRISSDLKISKSVLDFSENSLAIIDTWLVKHIECVKLSEEEYEWKRKNIPDYIEIDDWIFSSKTFSDIINIGIYLGETIIHKYPYLKWEQDLKNRKYIDYGHMVIKLGKADMNPIWLVHVLCTKIARQKEGSLHKLFRIWERHINL